MKKKIFLFALFLPFFVWSSLQELNPESYQSEKDQEALQYEVTVTLKLVQVFVSDSKGNPVTDLEKTDFLLYDNGELKKITDFETHFLPRPEKKIEKPKLLPAQKIPSRMNRKFLLIIDVYRNDGMGIIKSKKAAGHFIDTKLQPTDEVGVLSYSPYRGLILHEYLTSDHQKAKDVIGKIKDVPSLTGDRDGFVLSGEIKGRGEIGEESIRPFSQAENPESEIEKMKARNFSLNFNELAKSLRFIPGYKNIIFFSAGLSRSLLYDRNDPGVREAYQDMSKELGSSNSPVYAVNTAGTAAHLGSTTQKGDHALELLSNSSGGKYYENVDYYETIAADIQKATSNYYVLGYSIDEKWDGKFHEIKVKVNREGCEVHAQSGYFNPKPFAELTEFEKQLHLIDLALSEKSYFQDRLNFPSIAFPCSERNESNIVFLSEIPVGVKEAFKGKTELITLIFDKENNIIISNKGEVNFSEIPKENTYYYTISSLSPGEYSCRLVLRDLEKGKGAVGSSPVVIPKPPDTGLRLFPPLLLIPEKKAYYLRTARVQKQEKSEPLSLVHIYPFISNEHSPLIDVLDQATSKILGVLRYLQSAVQKPAVKLSTYLIQTPSGQRIPIPFSIVTSKKEAMTNILLMEFDLPELSLGEYSLEIAAEEMTTHEKSQVAQSFKVK